MSKKQPQKIEVQIRLSQLKPHPKQGFYFRELSDLELRALAEDMKENGQTTLAEVCSDGTMITGRQRCRAAKLLGWKSLGCWIRKDLEAQGPEAIERRLVQDNASRRQPTPAHEAGKGPCFSAAETRFCTCSW